MEMQINSPSDLSRAVDSCRKMITVGSKSFSLAARVFGTEEREAAFLLYGWCRFCDDTVDGRPNDPVSEKELRLKWLQEQTFAAYDGGTLEHDVFLALRQISRAFHIPRYYPLELLEGMAMDLRKESYPDFAKLALYSFRVAGTVGLMMSHVMGVSDGKALQHAVDLGIAMQLTNIARDVAEDARMGRVYLPSDWLAEAGVTPEDVLRGAKRDQIFVVIRRLLIQAEQYYRSGDQGLRYLKFRPACAVASARRVYSEIGNEILRRNKLSWDERIWIRTPRKLWAMAHGIWEVFLTIPGRLLNRWKAVPQLPIWRFS